MKNRAVAVAVHEHAGRRWVESGDYWAVVSDYEAMTEIFWALAQGEISSEEAIEAWRTYRSEVVA